VAANRIKNSRAQFFERIRLGENRFTQSAGSEATLWSLLDMEDQFAHGYRVKMEAGAPGIKENGRCIE
jgi:hypothetical protein